MSKKLTKEQIAAIRAKSIPKEHHKTSDEPFTVKKTEGLTTKQLINLQRGARGL